MGVILAAISAGGLVGVGDQYLCLFIMAIAARLGLITLNPTTAFMESWWFIGIMAVFWVITALPAYLSTASPLVLNAVNTAARFLSGFVVPFSAALLSLAAAGAIGTMHPDMLNVLETLRLFNAEGGIGATGWLVAGGGGALASGLTAMRFVAKPGIGAMTGTTGHLAAPANATAENIASIVLMTLAYGLSQINPWLLVALIVVVILLVTMLLGFALYQLWRLRCGVGRVLHLAQTYPKVGLAVMAEALLWGSGWLVWKYWGRGVVMLVFWGVFVSAIILAIPLFLPFAIFLGCAFMGIGLLSARSLLRTLEQALALPQSCLRPTQRSEVAPQPL